MVIQSAKNATRAGIHKIWRVEKILRQISQQKMQPELLFINSLACWKNTVVIQTAKNATRAGVHKQSGVLKKYYSKSVRKKQPELLFINNSGCRKTSFYSLSWLSQLFKLFFVQTLSWNFFGGSAKLFALFCADLYFCINLHTWESLPHWWTFSLLLMNKWIKILQLKKILLS